MKKNLNKNKFYYFSEKKNDYSKDFVSEILLIFYF